MPAFASVSVPLPGDVIAIPALAVIALDLLGDVSALVAATVTLAAVERIAEAAAMNWLGDGSWGGWGGGKTAPAPSFRSFFLVCTIVELCCWWKWLSEIYGWHAGDI